MSITANDHAPRGCGAILTAAHHVAVVDGEPIFPTAAALAIGDTVTVLQPMDPAGNLAVWSERYPGTIHRAAGACLTLLPSQPSPCLPADAFLTREIAAHVLYAYTGRGYAAGSFTRQLIAAIVAADPGNRARLALAFPGYVEAVRIASEVDRGTDYLAALMRGENRIAAAIQTISKETER